MSGLPSGRREGGRGSLGFFCAWAALLSSPIAAQQPNAASGKSDLKIVTVDGCAVAPADQLRFVISAGIGRYFPLRRPRDAARVTLSDPNVMGASCPTLRLDLAIQVKHEAREVLPSRAASGAIRLRAALLASVTYRSAPGSGGPKPAALADATLCVRRIDRLDLGLKGAPAWLTQAWLQDWLHDAVVFRTCFDITSLVYVFLERGGTLVPVP